MGLSLGTALRLVPREGARAADPSRLGVTVAFAGAGGKTTCMFSLARELASPCLLTTTTHLGEWQLGQADRHIMAQTAHDLVQLGDSHVTVVTGPRNADGRMSAVSPETLDGLRRSSLANSWPLLIEADGARQRPLKAAGPNEPQVPPFAELVVVIAGMSGLGRQLDSQTVHRAERFAELSGLRLGERVTGQAILQVLGDGRGGLAGIPNRARRLLVLNQAETAQAQAVASGLATSLLPTYDAVIVATAQTNHVHALHERSAGIVLAGGAATRFGTPKQLLAWRGEPLVRVATLAAIRAGLAPVIVVVGAHADQVERAVGDLPLAVVWNTNWGEGQASSLRTGLNACPASIGSAVFLLADQPLVTQEVIRALVAAHATEAAAIVAPLIDEGRRGNPVLFDRETFPALRDLRGDAGGRAIFARHKVHYMPWHDVGISRDIDTPEDYRSLLESDRA